MFLLKHTERILLFIIIQPGLEHHLICCFSFSFRLKCLSIKVYRLDPYRHIIHPHTWRMLRRACPGLRVCLYFEAIGAHADITRIACSELPLKVVQIWTGMNLQDEYWSLGSTIRYLGNTFSRTLGEDWLHEYWWMWKSIGISNLFTRKVQVIPRNTGKI